MSTMLRFKGASLTPLEWPHLSWIPFLPQGIRIEDYLDEDRYVVRAELPGIDPVEDLRITCVQGQLQLDVVRRDRRVESGRSEFRYGSFFRVIPLPAGVKEETLAATYTDGILEITAELGALEIRVREVPIRVETARTKTAETTAVRQPAEQVTVVREPAEKAPVVDDKAPVVDDKVRSVDEKMTVVDEPAEKVAVVHKPAGDGTASRKPARKQ